MLPSTPHVSVIMAAYNAAAFIDRSIESVRQQTFQNWELIVVDDCSSDMTREVVSKFAASDPRIVPVFQGLNGGPSAARNAGIARARGDWIAILDSDDRFTPDRLSFLIEKASSLQADILADNIIYYDEQAGVELHTAFALGSETLALTVDRLVANDGPPRIFSLGMLKPFIRRSFLVSAHILYDEQQRIGEDFQLLFQLLRAGAKALLLQKAGYIYTMAFGTASRQESGASRTDYNRTGWDRLVEANERMANTIGSKSPSETRLKKLFQNRSKAFIRERTWQQVKIDLRQRAFASLVSSLFKSNVILHVLYKSSNRFRESQRIV